MKTIEYQAHVAIEFLEDLGISIYEFTEMIARDPEWHHRAEFNWLISIGYEPKLGFTYHEPSRVWILTTEFVIGDLDYTHFILKYPHHA